MAAVAQQDWHAEALEMRNAGLSERQIAESVGKAPSTVHEFLAKIDADAAGDGDAPEAPDPQRLADAAGLTADRAEAAQPSPGQLTTDGQTVTAPIEDLRVDGTTQLGMFDAGGKKPSSASLRLTGGKVGLVDGRALRKGDVIRGSFTAVVDEVGQKDKADPKTGIVVSAEQKHSARIIDLTVEGASS